MKVCNSVNRKQRIYARWAFKDEKKPNRTLWIIDGESQDDFYRSTVEIDEKDVSKLITSLQTMLEK